MENPIGNVHRGAGNANNDEGERMIIPMEGLPPPPAGRRPVVTSGEEENHHDGSDSSSVGSAMPAAAPDQLFFDDQADDEDEAYVYKHLRSGVEEEVTVDRRPATELKASNEHPPHHGLSNNRQPSVPALPQPQRTQQRQKMLKPRHSDAILSCPCCFHIVCMDCQQHDRYDNLYRAMFVMGIAVQWDRCLRYDPQQRCLVVAATPSARTQERTIGGSSAKDDVSTSTSKVIPNAQSDNDDEEEEDDDDSVPYYTVICANCQTTVAALDMRDEVYHFSGCLASA